MKESRLSGRWKIWNNCSVFLLIVSVLHTRMVLMTICMPSMTLRNMCERLPRMLAAIPWPALHIRDRAIHIVRPHTSSNSPPVYRQ